MKILNGEAILGDCLEEMKKIPDESIDCIVTDPPYNEVDEINKLIQGLPENKKELVSDGYHTFKELYEHRVTLFVALCNSLKCIDEYQQCKHEQGTPPPPIFYRAWKSKLHADGTMYDGFFIAGIGLEKGNTITYHLPMSEWENFLCPEIPNSPEWDGHKSEDVIRLIKQL